MIHLACDDYDTPACGHELKSGDQITLKRQRVTCSACQMPAAEKKHRAYMETLKCPAERDGRLKFK